MTNLTADDLWQCLQDMYTRNQELQVQNQELKMKLPIFCSECEGEYMDFCQVCKIEPICSSCKKKEIFFTEWFSCDRECENCKLIMCKSCVRICTDCVNQGENVATLCKTCNPQLQRGRRRGSCSSCIPFWFTCDQHDLKDTGCPYGHSDEEKSN